MKCKSNFWGANTYMIVWQGLKPHRSVTRIGILQNEWLNLCMNPMVIGCWPLMDVLIHTAHASNCWNWWRLTHLKICHKRCNNISRQFENWIPRLSASKWLTSTRFGANFNLLRTKFGTFFEWGTKFFSHIWSWVRQGAIGWTATLKWSWRPIRWISLM